MHRTILLELITTLTARERQEARKWLLSPVHNERADVERLFGVVVEQVFGTGRTPERTDVYARIYPDQPYDDQQFRLLCSYLYRCLEDWLNWRQWQSQHPAPGHWLLEAYRNRNLDKAFVRQAQRQRELLHQSPLRHHQYHMDTYLLEHEVYLYQSRKGRGQPLNFQAQEEALQTATMAHKLRLACLSMAHQRVSGAQYHLALLPEILTLAQQAPYRDVPAIAVYACVYQMYQPDDTGAAFQQFRQVLTQTLHVFPDGERRDLILMGINYCIREINKKGEAYFGEALELYRQGLDNALLLEDGYLSAFTYSNITIIAIRSGELAWAGHFLEAYRDQLHPDQRAGTYALNAARLAYRQGNHRQALLLLHQFDDRDFIHQLSAKIIQLKVYYEAGDYQLLAAHIKNTRAYLRRIRHDSYHKQIYVNIFTLADQLMKLPPRDTAKRAALRQQILTTEPLTEREWLLAQVGTE